MKKTKIGVIGCGMISDAYFKASQTFRNLEVAACADVLPERARAKAELYGIEALSAEKLLARPDIEIVINLTPPQMHSKVDLEILSAGKHAYSEKPFGVDMADARKVIELAQSKGLRVGCAPDTFLGSAQQTARKALDDGWIGRPLAGTAIVASRGPEKWGHAPSFYDYGAGPMLDLGPYYCTALVNLLGPAKSVMAMTGKGQEFRTFGETVAEQYADRYKPFDAYPVNVTTHLTGVIEFQCGALITMIASFDVQRNGHNPIEIYGTEGTMLVNNPNLFGGQTRIFRREWKTIYEKPDWMELPPPFGYAANSRSIGAADMAQALEVKRPHRCSGELANHVLEIMLSFDKSSKLGAKVMLETTCQRPAPLPLGLENGEIR